MRRYVAKLKIPGLVFVMAVAGMTLLAPRAESHCDMLNGPVVSDARKALEEGNLEPVLKWVRAEDESEVRAVFEHVLKVRGVSPETRTLADRYFFETLVRIHRAGEGFPYTGLKPAGDPGPLVTMADRTLETGEVEALARRVGEAAAAGVRERFTRALEKKRTAGRSVEDGREYVEAYVSAVHYLENLHNAVSGGGAHGVGDDHDDDKYKGGCSQHD